jgi:hypothetical protein
VKAVQLVFVRVVMIFWQDFLHNQAHKADVAATVVLLIRTRAAEAHNAQSAITVL